VPLNSYIKYKNPQDNTVYLTSIQLTSFESGTPLVVKASYDGFDPVTVFSGYIYDFVLGMPLTIKAMDYMYFFNLGIFGSTRVSTTNKKGKITNTGTGVNYKSIQFKDLLQRLIDFVNETISLSTSGAQPVTLILPVFDMTLVNLTFISMSPGAILEWIKKEIGLNISLFNNQLYVNLASNTLNTVTLNTGRNVLKAPLQKNGNAFQRIRLKCWFIREDGTRDSLEVGDENGNCEEHFFYKVKRDATNYETLAQAALLKARQHRYHGELELLLYPDCDLFWNVDYTDLRYPEKNGVYAIIALDFELNQQGFHRKIKIAALEDLSTTTSVRQTQSR